MRTFKLENLPKKVKERICSIEFADDLIDNCIGLVNLKDNYEFDDGSHIEGFTNRKDLIEIVLSSYKVK